MKVEADPTVQNIVLNEEEKQQCLKPMETKRLKNVPSGAKIDVYDDKTPAMHEDALKRRKKQKRKDYVVCPKKKIANKCTQNPHTHYCCIQHKFKKAVDDTPDLEGFPSCQGNKSKLKQAIDILFAELADNAAKFGTPKRVAFWVHRKALQYQDGRRGDHTYCRFNANNSKEFWDNLIEQAFPKQNFGSNPNEGKLIAGYITGFQMRTYQTDDNGDKSKITSLKAGQLVKAPDNDGVCLPATLLSNKGDVWQMKFVKNGQVVSMKADRIWFDNIRHKDSSRANCGPGDQIKGEFHQHNKKLYCEQDSLGWRHGIWEFGAGDHGVCYIRSIDDIVAKKYWRGRNIKGGKYLCSCPKGQKCTCT